MYIKSNIKSILFEHNSVLASQIDLYIDKHWLSYSFFLLRISISSDIITSTFRYPQYKRKEKPNFFKTENNCVCFEKDIHYNNITLFWLHWFHLEYTLQLPKFCSKRYEKKQYKIQARRINLNVLKRANRGYFKLGVWRRFNPPAGCKALFESFETSSLLRVPMPYPVRHAWDWSLNDVYERI